jgi:hypothetical protein
MLRAVLGIHPDLPHGRLVLRPLWPAPFASLSVSDLPLGTGRLSLRVDADRGLTVTHVDERLKVIVEGGCPVVTA